MKPLSQFISEETIHTIAWTVMHSFWQGLLIALVFALVYYNLKNKTARFKYHLAFASLLAIVLSAACTFTMLYDGAATVSYQDYTVPTTVLSSADTYQLALSSNAPNWFDASIGFLDNNSTLIVGIWMMGLFFFLVKMLFGLYFVNQIRFSAYSLENKSWQNRIDKHLINLGSSRSVEIAQSALIKMPMMIGFLKPMILFPVGVINGMEIKEVEAIIAHELSHVLRNDYIMNIIQSCIEVLFYFNPAVWWLSSVVRLERENSCDDMAIQLTNSNVQYAKALLKLGHQQNSSNSLVMSFGGKKKKLLLRVQRVLNNSQYKPRVMEKIITSILLLVLIVGISMGANTNDSPAHTTVETLEFPNSIFVQGENSNELKEYISIDTLPNKGKASCQIMYYNDDKRVDIWKENDRVIKLWIDGKRIEEKDFSKYQGYIDEVPEMPLPPVPPSSVTDIELKIDAFNISPNSVEVHIDSKKLVEGRDYEIDYQLGRMKIINDDVLKHGGALKISFDDNQGNKERRQQILGHAKNHNIIITPPVPPEPLSPPGPPAPLSPPTPKGKGNLDDLGSMMELMRSSNGEITQESIEKHQAERERIMKELKSLSEITFIDSLHPTLKMVETEDGISILEFDNFDAVGFENNNLVLKNNTARFEELSEMLQQQTQELNNQMAGIDFEIMTELENELIHIDGMRLNLDDLTQIKLSEMDGLTVIVKNGLVQDNHNGSEDLVKVLESSLVSDGLITTTNEYSIKLTEDYFKLNGKKLDDSQHQKYLNLIKAESGAKENQTIKFVRSVKSNKVQNSFSIFDES